MTARFRLNALAQEDLAQIAAFGPERFGLTASRQYYDALFDRFEEIATAPRHYPAVHEIRPGYSRSVYKEHCIFYRQTKEGVEIMRILGRQNAAGVL